MSAAKIRCTDRVVGSILASWRYDISGISPEMRKDYEKHLAECARCSGRQKFHRSLDASLIVLTSVASLFFLFALAVMKHVRPLEHVAFKMLGLDIYDMYHMLVSAGIAGLLLFRDFDGPGSHGHSRSVLSERHCRRAREAHRAALTGRDSISPHAIEDFYVPQKGLLQWRPF